MFLFSEWIRSNYACEHNEFFYFQSEYEAIKEGKIDANQVLKKYVKTKEGETLDGWGEAEMKTIKTFVRTKSGKLVEKTIVVSKEDYEKLEQLKKEGKDPGEILNKYMSINDGEKVEGWKKPETAPMKVCLLCYVHWLY